MFGLESRWAGEVPASQEFLAAAAAPLAAGLRGSEVSLCVGLAGRAAEGEDSGVVDKAVDHGGGGDVVGETPAWRPTVSGSSPFLVAVGLELAEEIGSF